MYPTVSIATTPLSKMLLGTPLLILSGRDAVDLARFKNGSLYSWGHNEHGQLGHGDLKHRDVPERIKYFDGAGRGENTSVLQVLKISLGGFHVIVTAQHPDGCDPKYDAPCIDVPKVFSWALNYNRQARLINSNNDEGVFLGSQLQWSARYRQLGRLRCNSDADRKLPASQHHTSIGWVLTQSCRVGPSHNNPLSAGTTVMHF